jgi:hypothetical protein
MEQPTLSCKVSISSFKRFFCSWVSLASQASLSNLTGSVVDAVGDEVGSDGLVEDVLGFGLGWPKNDVMAAFDFVFFADSVAISAALRLRDIVACIY